MPIKMFPTFAGKAISHVGRFVALALPVFLVTAEPVQAGDSFNYSCVGAGRSFSCMETWGGGRGGIARIVQVPGPLTDQEIAAATARERRWLARCQPVIQPDRYGVGRYIYKAAGCEFAGD